MNPKFKMESSFRNSRFLKKRKEARKKEKRPVK